MERLKRVGTIEPRCSANIKGSRLGIGMEKLDRDAFDPEKVYDKVAALGVKWVRIQSGWQKTERKEGVYDFAWLDSQVDNLLARGLEPWLCLCYGNEVYDELAKEYFGAVGCPPIRTERAYNAWLRYVDATIEHFRGRIEYYEIWNEPEGGWTWRPEPNPSEYAEFCMKTGRVIKSCDPSAKVIVGSHYQNSMEFLSGEIALGVMEVADAISYHSYDYDESISMQRIKAFRTLAKLYGKEIEIIQGESGSQSKSGGNGAFGWIRTNQDMQTKYLLRHTVAELISGVKLTSVFSSVDMAENLDAKADGLITTCGYFGVLGAEFDSSTGKLVGDYYEKKSYYAFRNICSIFDEDVRVAEIPVLFTPQKSKRLNGFDCPTKELIYGSLSKANGAKAFVYWNSTDLIICQGYESTATFEIAGACGDIHLVDPMDGSVYELPEKMVKDKGNRLWVFENMPVKDYPLILTFGDFLK